MIDRVDTHIYMYSFKAEPRPRRLASMDTALGNDQVFVPIDWLTYIPNKQAECVK